MPRICTDRQQSHSALEELGKGYLLPPNRCDGTGKTTNRALGNEAGVIGESLPYRQSRRAGSRLDDIPPLCLVFQM
jgi:hypothetical protein